MYVKGIAHSGKPTQNYHLTPQFPSALQSLLASFSSLFWFSSCNFTVLVYSHRPHQCCFKLHQQKNNNINCTSAQHQTADKVSN